MLGHSEGGTIAMMLAAEGKADFIVSLAGMAISGKETLMMQNHQAMSAIGLEATAQSVAVSEAIVHPVGEGIQVPHLLARIVYHQDTEQASFEAGVERIDVHPGFAR